ncbi:MAG: fliM [Rickettsiales bacterium]|nr:fliM [Rickettsiales bacterium]
MSDEQKVKPQAGTESSDAEAAEWEAMLSAGNAEGGGGASGDTKALNQDEIDSLLGFEAAGDDSAPKTGIYAMLDKALLSYQRLPLLEIVFDRFIRMLSTSLRNFTSDNIDVDIHSITSLRFEDYVNSIPMPALLSVFKAVEWENYGLVTFDGSLVYSMVDVLFGGRKSTRPIRIEGRPYTTIEQGIVKHITEIMLGDMGTAFDPLSPASFQFERLETNPRFATIARPADAAILLQLRVDMEERGGNIEVLLPYATLEPIRELLSQVFMGEKFGKDPIWEHHLGKEVYRTTVTLEAVLDKKKARLGDIAGLKVGSTIIMNNTPDDDIKIRCQGVEVLQGRLGRVEDNVAVSVTDTLNTHKLQDLL